MGCSIAKLAATKAASQQNTSIICCQECCSLTGSERQVQRKANASEGRSLLTSRPCISCCGCVGAFAALQDATCAQGCPSALRPGRQHHARRGECRLRRSWLRAHEGKCILIPLLCTLQLHPCCCCSAKEPLTLRAAAASQPSALRPRRRHHARRGERGLRRGRLRAHEADAGLWEERLDDAGRLQRPPPRDARVHILQEVVAVPCACSPVTSSQHHCSG